MSDTDESTGSTESGETTDPGNEGVEELGDAGKKALDAMKAKWTAERDGAKPWKQLARELGVKSPEDIKALIAGKSAEQDDAGRAVREATAAAEAKANAKIVRAEVKAAAAGKFADPADAAAFLDLTEFEVNEDGDVDQDAIAAALDDLLKKKPHLAAQGGRRFAGGGDGGHRGEARVDPGPGIPRLTHAYATASKTK
jgi:hypothetical protein